VKGCIPVVPNRIRHLRKTLIRCLSQKSNDCTRRQTDGRYIVNATIRGRSHEAYTTLKRITTHTLRCYVAVFTRAMLCSSAAIAVLCVCTLCLSARSRCSIETTGRIELVFGTNASLSCRIHCRFAVKKSVIYKVRSRRSGTFSQTLDLKGHHGTSIVATCCQLSDSFEFIGAI